MSSTNINYPIDTFWSQFGPFSATVKFSKNYNNTTLKEERYEELHIYEYIRKKEKEKLYITTLEDSWESPRQPSVESLQSIPALGKEILKSGGMKALSNA